MSIPLDDNDGAFDKDQIDQINRVKELRSQKRKLNGSDYVPFDESTSGGVFAKDQINAANNCINDLEGHMLQRHLIKQRYQSEQLFQTSFKASGRRNYDDEDQN